MIRSLLAGAIDYAGLFPPAGLPMRDVVSHYCAYRMGPDAWALGRLVIPASRLGQLAAAALTARDDPAIALPTDDSAAIAAAPAGAACGAPWRVSALVSGDGSADLAVIHDFNKRHAAPATQGWAAVVDAVEARATTPGEVAALAASRDAAVELFVEVAPDDGLPEMLEAIAAHRLAAKIRTGGVTPEQFPSAVEVARFIEGCARLSLPFKATAGLHHALRASYRLTYAPDSAHGAMFGFLNVFLAAAAARAGAGVTDLAQLLDERSPDAFDVGDRTVSWRGLAFTVDDIAAVRSGVALSFGSCSFEEPLSELRSLGLLEHAS